MPAHDKPPVCNCQIHVLSMGVHSEKPVLKVPFNVTEACETSAIQFCVETCKDEIGNLTNNLDLDHPVNFTHHEEMSLGQLVCDMLYKEMFHHQIGLEAHFSCVDGEGEGGDPVLIDETVPTHIHSKYDFSCVESGNWHGHVHEYKKGRLVEPTQAPSLAE